MLKLILHVFHQITASCQLACRQSGVLDQLEEILLASGIPADVLTEAINTIAELIRHSCGSGLTNDIKNTWI